MEALRQFCATQKAYIPISYEEIVFTFNPNTYFYLTPKLGILHFQFFHDGKVVKLLPDLYHIGFPQDAKNHVQLYKNVLQYYWDIIQKEFFAVQGLMDEDEKECYYTNFYAFDECYKKESLTKRKDRILKELKLINFEQWGIKFTKSKMMIDFKWHVYVKFHSTYWMLKIRQENAKRIDVLMPNIIQHTCYLVQEILQKLISK